MTLTILLGDYGSGKTTTAKHMVKLQNGIYLDVDTFVMDKNKYSNLSFVEKLNNIIKPGVDYFIDGWPSNQNFFNLNSDNLAFKVKYVVCLCSFNKLKLRQLKKQPNIIATLPRTIEDMKHIMYMCISIALTLDNNPVFADTTTYPPKFYRKDEWLSLVAELTIYDSFNQPNDYQDIELNSHIIPGLSKSHKTWERLDALLDFTNKSVIDYGCNFGYFSFKAEAAGARCVTGIDESLSAIQTAMGVSIIKNSNVSFHSRNLLTYKPPKIDIIMALNVLHHLKYDKDVLNRMFNQASTLVFEIPTEHFTIIEEFRKKYGFGIAPAINSHRFGRLIVIYSKSKPIVIPKKYKYHRIRIAIKKILFRHLTKIMKKADNDLTRKIKYIARKLI